MLHNRAGQYANPDSFAHKQTPIYSGYRLSRLRLAWAAREVSTDIVTRLWSHAARVNQNFPPYLKLQQLLCYTIAHANALSKKERISMSSLSMQWCVSGIAGFHETGTFMATQILIAISQVSPADWCWYDVITRDATNTRLTFLAKWQCVIIRISTEWMRMKRWLLQLPKHPFRRRLWKVLPKTDVWEPPRHLTVNSSIYHQ